MPLTLIEAAKRMQNGGMHFEGTVVEIYARSSDLLMVLPFSDIPGNALAYNIESALPGVGFRGVNEGYTESTGIINPVVEPLVIAGGDVDVDMFILTTQGENQRAEQEAMKIKALGHLWTNTFFKGDSESNIRQFDGLQKRIIGRQLVSAGTTSGGDPLSLKKLDLAISRCDNPTHIALSVGMALKFSAAARTPGVGGYITYSKDEFGRTIMQYNGLPFIIVGNNGDVYDTLAFNEAAASGGTTACSMYILSLGTSKTYGIQNSAPNVWDLGQLEAKPTKRTRIEWYNGMTVKHPRAAVRLYGIADADIVA